MPILFFLLFFSWQNALAASDENIHRKFEWGVGTLSVYGNHYRGSDQGKFWFFPMPYFTYSSERIEAEPSFIRGIFIRTERFSFKLSLMAGLNVESKKNRAREGMPTLDYTLEAGPMFIFHLWKSEKKNLIINFEWPIRETFATDFSYIKPVGFFTVPYISVTHSSLPESRNWSWELSVSPMFADQKYHQYFYGVDKQFEKIDRQTYRAHGGYSGFQTAVVLNKHINNLVIIPFARWDYLGGTVFKDSPLFKVNNYAIAGLGLFWLFD